ncbi:hypothetical protein D9M72_567000 [compost metagenome]
MFLAQALPPIAGVFEQQLALRHGRPFGLIPKHLGEALEHLHGEAARAWSRVPGVVGIVQQAEQLEIAFCSVLLRQEVDATGCRCIGAPEQDLLAADVEGLLQLLAELPLVILLVGRTGLGTILLAEAFGRVQDDVDVLLLTVFVIRGQRSRLDDEVVAGGVQLPNQA